MDIKISNFPGFYLCNYIYFWALYLSKNNYPAMFIHIPSNGEKDDHTNKIKLLLRAIIELEL